MLQYCCLCNCTGRGRCVRVATSLFPSTFTPLPLPLLLLPALDLQAWDNVHGQNVQFVKKTGLGALGVASAVTLIAMVAEKQPKKARK